MTSDRTGHTPGNIQLRTFVTGPIETNTYLLVERSSGEGVLVDPAEYSAEIDDIIRREGVKVKFILNTHGHADHIMGDSSFGYPVLIHPEDIGCFTDPSRSLSSFMPGGMPVPDDLRTVSDGDTVHIGEIGLKVIHTPGHSPGGISLHCGGFVLSGDTLFFEGIGRTDLPGGDYRVLADSIKKKLFVLPDELEVFPGHGPSTTIGHEKKHNVYL
ncbi:MAG: MBL fold metallo-hydrolase [Candidatus Omnitrophica bacterium]|nr:MBL fold metallo-hydrolase [Candidatus Omnitrophota bacterium]